MSVTFWIWSNSAKILGICALSSNYFLAPSLLSDNGLIPIREYLPSGNKKKLSDFLRTPSIFHFIEPSANNIQIVAGTGILLFILSIFQIFEWFNWFLAMFCLLSFCSVGQSFFQEMDYQLLEVNAIGFFSAIPIYYSNSFFLFYLLGRFYNFRMYLSCGLWKAWPTCWRENEAMPRHYWTQPSPGPLAPLFAQLPNFFHIFSCKAVLFIELPVPFLIFFIPELFPVYISYFTFLNYVGLQALIASAGNFAYLSLMCAITSIVILSEADVSAVFSSVSSEIVVPGADAYFFVGGLVSFYTLCLSIFYLTFGSVALCQHLLLPKLENGTFARLVAYLEDIYEEYVLPFKLINTYRKFAITSEERWEIVIEGSNDCLNWLPYELNFKAGDPRKKLSFVPIHLPRLDWRLWYIGASLRSTLQKKFGDPRHSQWAQPKQFQGEFPLWFSRLLKALFIGDQTILNWVHFCSIPFPNGVKYLRIRFFCYEFGKTTTWERTDLNIFWKKIALTKDDI